MAFLDEQDERDDALAWEQDAEYLRPTPTWEKPCEGFGCDAMVSRYRGQGDVTCDEGTHSYNAGGQRLRDDYRGNPSMYDDDISDLDGYEMQYAGDY